MKATLAFIPPAFLVLAAFPAPALAQTAGSQQQQPEFIQQGQQLMREGKLDDALALYRQTLQTSPNSVPANHPKNVPNPPFLAGAKAIRLTDGAL